MSKNREFAEMWRADKGRERMSDYDMALLRIEHQDAEIERLRALLNDPQYIRMKADYNRGHLSWANMIEERERGLGLRDTHVQQSPAYDQPMRCDWCNKVHTGGPENCSNRHKKSPPAEADGR